MSGNPDYLYIYMYKSPFYVLLARKKLMQM